MGIKKPYMSNEKITSNKNEKNTWTIHVKYNKTIIREKIWVMLEKVDRNP